MACRRERGRRNGCRPFSENAENTRERGRESQFSEDLRTLLLGQWCLAAL